MNESKHTAEVRELKRVNADLLAACEAAAATLYALVLAHESEPFRSHLDPMRRYQNDARNVLGLARAAIAKAKGGE